MPITIDFSQIADKVTSKTLLLTPNSRTQKAMIAGYIASMREGQVVYAPNIKSLKQWVEEILAECSFQMRLPSLVGKLELKAWLKDLIGQEEKWQLTNQLGVAQKVLDAYQTLIQWGLTIDEIETPETIENIYFVKWIKALEALLVSKSLLAEFSQIQWLVQKVQDSNNPSVIEVFKSLMPEKILLIGFDQLTPVESDFLDLCRVNQVEIAEFYPNRIALDSARVELISFHQEIEFAAKLALNLSCQNSEQTIGVVVHQLASHLDLVHRVFSDRFQPDELHPWQSLQKINYNVSAGQILSELPMIATGLQLLELNASGLDLPTLIMLKTTPFINWGSQANIIRRFLHEQALRSYSHYSIERLVGEIDRHPQQQTLKLLRDRLSELNLRENRAKPMSAWVDSWHANLRSWGWLAEYELDENETKQLAEFDAALSETLKLNLIYPVCSLTQSREFLQQTLRQTAFQTPSDRTNVHVLGVLEATGLEFDQLIMVGFNRENWPQKAKLSPFIPANFQRHHNMRGSSAEREYIYAKGISNSLVNCATKIYITQCKSEDDQLFTGSPFFESIPLKPAEKYLAPEEKRIVIADYIWKFDENINVDGEAISGGAYLLSTYATCPFKALTTFQFKLKAAQQPQKGIDPRVKGGWLHLSMELLWNKLQTQQALVALSAAELESLVGWAIEKAKLEYESQLFATTSLPIIQLEIEKLTRQILEWLQIEKQRSPFSAQTEVEKQLTVGPLQLKLRIDRIDTNKNGKLEIIDYKTGDTQVKKWLGARPEEAQMPAYVLACDPAQVDSLSYAQIRTGSVLRSGVNFNQDDIHTTQWFEMTAEKTKDTSRTILSDSSLVDLSESISIQWKKHLENLAINIANGVMPVSPKHLINSCRYCDYSDICRISEQQPRSNATSSMTSEMGP